MLRIFPLGIESPNQEKMMNVENKSNGNVKKILFPFSTDQSKKQIKRKCKEDFIPIHWFNTFP